MVLAELIFNSSIFRGHSGLDRTDFEQFLYWDSVIILKELILTVSTLGRYGGLQSTDF